MSKSNNDSNVLLWIAGLGVVGIGAYFIIRAINRKNNNQYVVNIPSEQTTTDTGQETQQETLKDRAKNLAKDATNNVTSRAIDSLFNRMFN